MTDIQPYVFPATGQQVRTIRQDGEPWFVAADVAAVLELGNLHSSLALLDDDERSLHTVESAQRSMATVSEAGLYSLILRSRKAEAKAFKRWITHDVLPTLRKTGRYEVAEVSRKELARMVIEAEEARELAEERLAATKAHLSIVGPKAEAWEVLASAHGDYSVREAAFMLNRDPAIDTGQQRLFRALREFGLIDRRDIPYASHAAHVRLRSTSYTHPRTGEQVATKQLRVSLEGLRYLHRKLGGTAPFESIAPAA